MTFEHYSTLAKRTDRPMEFGDLHALHMLAAEVGELHSIYQKQFQGHKIDQTKMILEMGDVLWALDKLARMWNVSLNYVARQNLEKLKKRYPDGFTEDASRNRKE